MRREAPPERMMPAIDGPGVTLGRLATPRLRKSIWRRSRHSESGARRTAIISATTETAISSGVMAPISSPMGAKTRSKAARGDAFLLQLLHHADHLALAADHGDVLGVGFHRPAQHAHVVAMAARDDHHIAGVADGKLREDFLVLFGVDFVGFRESLAVGEGIAIIHHHRGESGRARRPWKCFSKCGRRRR